jgi:hypothetical protein
MCARREVTLLAEHILHGVYSTFGTLFPSLLFTLGFSVFVMMLKYVHLCTANEIVEFVRIDKIFSGVHYVCIYTSGGCGCYN